MEDSFQRIGKATPRQLKQRMSVAFQGKGYVEFACKPCLTLRACMQASVGLTMGARQGRRQTPLPCERAETLVLESGFCYYPRRCSTRTTACSSTVPWIIIRYRYVMTLESAPRLT